MASTLSSRSPSLQLGVYARSGLTRVSPVASLQGSRPPVHRRAGRLEAWHARHPLPVQCPGQETPRSPLSEIPRWKAQPHLRSVSLLPVHLAAPDVYAAEISLGRGPDPQRKARVGSLLALPRGNPHTRAGACGLRCKIWSLDLTECTKTGAWRITNPGDSCHPRLPAFHHVKVRKSSSFFFSALPAAMQARPGPGHADGQVPRDRLRLRLAVVVDRFVDQRARSRPGRLPVQHGPAQG